MVSIPHVKEEQWTFALQFYLDPHGLPHLDKASINEVYYEDAPAKPTTTTTNPTPGKEGETKPTEAPTEPPKVEKVKKERSTVCIIKLVESLMGLPQAILDNITLKEANQENDDKHLHIVLNKRNEIENFIYSTRSKLEADLAPFVTNEEKELLTQLMQTVEDWLYSGDEAVYDKPTLEAKSKDLNELGTKIYKRYHDWGKLFESLQKLEQCVNLNARKLEENTAQTACLSQADREELGNIVVSYNSFLNDAKAQYTKFPKFGDAPIRYEDVDKSSEELVKVK